MRSPSQDIKFLEACRARMGQVFQPLAKSGKTICNELSAEKLAPFIDWVKDQADPLKGEPKALIPPVTSRYDLVIKCTNPTTFHLFESCGAVLCSS